MAFIFKHHSKVVHLFKRKSISNELLAFVCKRNLNVHEHIGLSILKENGISVPLFGVASTSEEAVKIASVELKLEP